MQAMIFYIFSTRGESNNLSLLEIRNWCLELNQRATVSHIYFTKRTYM